MILIVHNCLFHFYISGFSTFFRVVDNVEFLSTVYPLCKRCGFMWKTHKTLYLLHFIDEITIVEKIFFNNLHVDFINPYV